MKKLNAIKGIIFDLDGTLVQSNLDFQYLRDQVGCPQGTDILEYIDSLEQNDREKAHRVVKDYEMSDAQQASWIEGAQSLVLTLSKNDFPMAIVTRNCRQATRLKLQNNEVPIDFVLTREDGPAKPDPTSLMMIQAQWQVAAEDLAYVGDYLYDVEAAIHAGMIACLYAPEEKPHYAAKADFVFSHFQELADAL